MFPKVPQLDHPVPDIRLKYYDPTVHHTLPITTSGRNKLVVPVEQDTCDTGIGNSLQGHLIVPLPLPVRSVLGLMGTTDDIDGLVARGVPSVPHADGPITTTRYKLAYMYVQSRDHHMQHSVNVLGSFLIVSTYFTLL